MGQVHPTASATGMPGALKPFKNVCHLPERHIEQHLHRQAGLDSCVTIVRPSATFANWLGLHVISGSNQIVSEPRRFRPSLQMGQFLVL